MKATWQKSDQKLFGVPCLELSVTYDGKTKGTDRELCLFGKHGEIYKNNDVSIKIHIYKPLYQRKYNTSTFTIDTHKNINDWKKRLGVPKNIGKQLALANGTNE